MGAEAKKKFKGWSDGPYQENLAFDVMTREEARGRIGEILHAGYLGNDPAKDALIDYLGPAMTTAHEEGGVNPRTGLPRTNRSMGPSAVGLFGPPSTGKTTLIKLMARVAQLPFLELDGTCRNQEQLADKLFEMHAKTFRETEGYPGGMADLGGGRYVAAPCVVFFDEAHLLDGGGKWLLKCTERKDVTLICSQGQIDTTDIFWVLGTTNPEFLDDALFTRLNQLWLQPYTAAQVASILALDYPQVSADDRLLLARYGGLVPRVAWDLADQSVRKAAWDQVSVADAVRAVADRQGIDEEGISHTHVRILRVLHANGNQMAKSRLAAAVGVPEMQLEKMHLPRLILATPERPSLVRMTSRGVEMTEPGLEAFRVRSEMAA